MDYWLNTFDWRKAEESLNCFANYELTVNDIDLHFIHERSSDPDAIPLILSHGWPGSIYEFHKIIKKLTSPGLPCTGHWSKCNKCRHTKSASNFSMSSSVSDALGLIVSKECVQALAVARDRRSMLWPPHCQAMASRRPPRSRALG